MHWLIQMNLDLIRRRWTLFRIALTLGVFCLHGFILSVTIFDRWHRLIKILDINVAVDQWWWVQLRQRIKWCIVLFLFSINIRHTRLSHPIVHRKWRSREVQKFIHWSLMPQDFLIIRADQAAALPFLGPTSGTRIN